MNDTNTPTNDGTPFISSETVRLLREAVVSLDGQLTAANQRLAEQGERVKVLEKELQYSQESWQNEARKYNEVGYSLSAGGCLDRARRILALLSAAPRAGEQGNIKETTL